MRLVLEKRDLGEREKVHRAEEYMKKEEAKEASRAATRQEYGRRHDTLDRAARGHTRAASNLRSLIRPLPTDPMSARA